jgi:cytochrome P450
VRLRNGETAWLATRYEDVRALLADNRFSSDARKEGYPQLSASRAVVASTEGVLPINYTDPPDHTRFRRALMKEFSVARVQELKPLVDAVINDLIDKMLEHGSPVDLISEFALPVPTTVILKLLGIPYGEHQFFHERANRIVATDLDPALTRQAQQELRGRMLEIIREKEKNPDAHDDIIGRLAGDHIQTGNLNYEEACSLCQSLVIAGHETTASTIGLGTLSLLRRPEAFERLRNDTSSKLVAQAVEEMLRFWSIAHYIGMRVALEDVEFGGVTIKAGDGILAQIMAANHDPTVFANPEEFDIDRQSKYPHVAFGYGIHQCIGQQLARWELRAVFDFLPKRIPTLRLAVPFEDLEFKHGALAHGLRALPLAW